MNKPRPKNMAASVSDRLKRIAHESGGDAMRLVIRYANERFLYRLGMSSHRDKFILKGATLFAIWAETPHRNTRDLDFLASGDNSPEAMQVIFQEVCQVSVEDDGLTFLPETLRVEPRRDEETYPGLHVDITATLGNARIPLQIDLGFGDAVTPPPAEVDIPVVLSDFPKPRLRAYPRETVVAEKLEVMVNLGITNSRMKDYYDLWYLSQNFTFDSQILAAAVKATFNRRGTAVPANVPLALTDAFALDTAKQAQWDGFLRRSGLKASGPDLTTVVTALREFLTPILNTIRTSEVSKLIWSPDGSWSKEQMRPVLPLILSNSPDADGNIGQITQ